jgi:hypothetical protein
MSWSKTPNLSLAIAPLSAVEAEQHYAIWVLQAAHPGGYVHQDRFWLPTLTQIWRVWHEFFSTRPLLNNTLMAASDRQLSEIQLADSLEALPSPGQQSSYGSRLMQLFGIQLWAWLFEGKIHNSLSESQGFAIAKNMPLRLRVDLRDPNLIVLPWEIMQQPGKQAISLSQQLLFSRTTTDVAPLSPRSFDTDLKILLVVGQQADEAVSPLDLEREAQTIAEILKETSKTKYKDRRIIAPVSCQVDILVQPTPPDLTGRLERESYNLFFYAGHGIPAPDGGLLFLCPDTPPLSGTELAQILTRRRVTLAVFNTCWGAESAHDGQGQAIPRSSLAEVLVHHGVPAVLAMRDAIADQEALSFIEAFAQALTERVSIDEAVAIARQHLLTLYKFNQPAWTLPVLYMHPEFSGYLLQPLAEGTPTELPELSSTWMEYKTPTAFIRVVGLVPEKIWRIRGGIMRVGRQKDNDLVIEEGWVSQKHAEIFCRDLLDEREAYYLRDFSRYGTLVYQEGSWQRVHHQEIALQAGMRLKFGSSHGQELEFFLENDLQPAC